MVRNASSVSGSVRSFKSNRISIETVRPTSSSREAAFDFSLCFPLSLSLSLPFLYNSLTLFSSLSLSLSICLSLIFLSYLGLFDSLSLVCRCRLYFAIRFVNLTLSAYRHDHTHRADTLMRLTSFVVSGKLVLWTIRAILTERHDRSTLHAAKSFLSNFCMTPEALKLILVCSHFSAFRRWTTSHPPPPSFFLFAAVLCEWILWLRPMLAWTRNVRGFQWFCTIHKRRMNILLLRLFIVK